MITYKCKNGVEISFRQVGINEGNSSIEQSITIPGMMEENISTTTLLRAAKVIRHNTTLSLQEILMGLRNQQHILVEDVQTYTTMGV